MTPEEFIYEFELSADKVSSKNAMNLSLPAKVAYLNRGQRSLVLTTYNGNNKERTGFEESAKRKADLQRLVVPHETLTVEKETARRYYARLSGTKEPFLLLLNHSAYGTKGTCKAQEIATEEVQLDDLQEALASPFRRPDFQWRTALLTMAMDRLWVYTDGFFSIDSLVIGYLRLPRRIDVSGYTGFDGKPSVDAACELPESLHDAIVAEAVCNLKADLGDPAYQTAVYKKQTIE